MKFFVKVMVVMLGIGVLFVVLSMIFLPEINVMGSLVTRNDEYGEIIVFSEDSEFTNLTIDLKNRHVNVNFVDEDSFTMSYYKHDNDIFEFGLLNQTLVIDQDFESIWSNIFLFNFVSRQYVTVDINIPNDWDMTDLNIVTDTGDIVINPNELKTFGDVTLKNAVGRIELSSLSANNLSAETSTGDVILENVVVLEQTSIDLSTGRIELTDLTTSNLYLESSTGDVVLNDITAEDVKIVSSTGKALISDSVFETLDVKVSTGRIDISHVTSNDYMLKTSTGDIHIILASYDDLKFDLSTGTGHVSIDGLKQGSAYQSLDGTIDFVAQTNTGNITIEVDA